MSHETIVVTGATGNIGRRTATALAGRSDTRVIAFVRDATRAADLAAVGATLREGTYEDADSLREAFAGADTVLLVTSGPRQVDQGLAALEAARAQGVGKIIQISGIDAGPDAPATATRRAGEIEAAIRASGLTHVFLRGNSFMQNLLPLAPTIRAQSKLYYGVGDAKMGMVDTRDIADAVVAVATTDRWDDRTFELCGPESIDFHRVARALGRELGRDVAYVAVPPEAVGEAIRDHGGPAWLVEAVVEFCVANGRGFSDRTTDHVAMLTGHPARSIEDFVQDLLAPAVRGA